MQFEQTTKTKVNRTASRASYDKDVFASIVDDVKFGHLAFTDDKGVHSVPMLFWRDSNFVYFHSSVGSRLAKLPETKQDICISFAVIDGYVFAKSAFRHSVNYRSAVIYGQCKLVPNNSPEKLEAFKALVDLYAKERWEQIRQPSPEELAATALLKLPIIEAVVKVRSGPPNDKEDDRSLDVWAGVIPYVRVPGEPEQHNY
jgi:hypothetical protein